MYDPNLSERTSRKTSREYFQILTILKFRILEAFVPQIKEK